MTDPIIVSEEVVGWKDWGKRWGFGTSDCLQNTTRLIGCYAMRCPKPCMHMCLLALPLGSGPLQC